MLLLTAFQIQLMSSFKAFPNLSTFRKILPSLLSGQVTFGQEGLLSVVDRTSDFPSLQIPLPGFEEPAFLPEFTQPAETIVTTLPNGLRIGTQNSEESCVSVGLLVDSGCIYEDSRTCGVSHLLEKMAFHSTKNRSIALLMQEAQAVAVNFTSSSACDQMFYTGHGIKTFFPQIVEILLDSVRNAAFEELEVKEQLLRIEEESRYLESDPEALLIRRLHSTGYSGDYAKSYFASKSSMTGLDSLTLHEFVDENYTASRMVLSAVGVEHQKFLAIAEPLLLDLPKMPSSPMPKFKYVGGDWREPKELPDTHIALAFEVPNGWQNERLANTLTVLKYLLGSGESFSVGGPGKGMYTRFYKNVLKHPEVQAIQTFSSIYNYTGLFGVLVCTNSDFASQTVDITCDELLSITSRGKVTNQEFERAKNATISAVLMSLECRTAVIEDIACQIMSYGRRYAMSVT
ncbi:hypothetical protein GOP47_0023470 [Adiantum capillus-veneris]|uniref:Alpha-MPP n=1 Tax=Adiantum capillus-veneris TaxID=13818 RepID=A0A9D4U417_ADICA|nr:hypothetical protein GOP47_0023470 [Adiantum capillus-veneris]